MPEHDHLALAAHLVERACSAVVGPHELHRRVHLDPAGALVVLRVEALLDLRGVRMHRAEREQLVRGARRCRERDVGIVGEHRKIDGQEDRRTDPHLVHLPREVRDRVRRPHASWSEASQREVDSELLHDLWRHVAVDVDVEIDRATRRQVVLRLGVELVQVDAHRPHVGERQVRVHVRDRTDALVRHDEAPLLGEAEPRQTRQVEQRRESRGMHARHQ